jgi:tRNA (cmo5U34)-methyltransferase
MQLNSGKTWVFDKTVADNFVPHAKQHIPNYDLVIDKSIKICNKLIDKTDPILDIGCATGHTLSRLYNAGYTNLHGVDNSQEMLDNCPKIASYYCSESFPNTTQQFSAVLANWTFHFINNKVAYLTDIYNHLDADGFLIVSDKISEDSLDIELYHDWKIEQGCTPEEVVAKQQSLKCVMKVKDISWWLLVLQQIGFTNVSIIDASWCFCSILALK